jgi:hypothetical protein
MEPMMMPAMAPPLRSLELPPEPPCCRECRICTFANEWQRDGTNMLSNASMEMIS